MSAVHVPFHHAGLAFEAVNDTRSELRAILTVGLRAGQIMLENGANTARVEDTVRRITRFYGAEHIDASATPNGITLSIDAQDDHRTRMLRIVSHGVDLSRVAAVLDLVGEIESGWHTREAALAALDNIARQPRVYNRWQTALGVGVAGACFALLFGGGLWEFVIVLVAGICAQAARERLAHAGMNRLLLTVVVTAIATGLALLLALPAFAMLHPPGPHPSLAVVVAAAGILLIPGILMISSIADLFRGDTLAGMIRGTMALLTILAIGFGIWLVLLLCSTPIVVKTTPPTNVLMATVAACVGAAGFGVLFDVPPRFLLLAALTGGIGYLGRAWGLRLGFTPEAAALMGGLAVGVSAEAWAWAFHAPTSLFTIPGFIPLVPGVWAFRAVLNFANADYAAGTSDMVRAVLITSAVAAGLGLVTAVARLPRPAVRQRNK